MDLCFSLPGYISLFWCGVLHAYSHFRLGLHVYYGNGDNTQFRHDWWLGEQNLALAFPSLYEIASNQCVSVSFYYQMRQDWCLTMHIINPCKRYPLMKKREYKEIITLISLTQTHKTQLHYGLTKER